MKNIISTAINGSQHEKRIIGEYKNLILNRNLNITRLMSLGIVVILTLSFVVSILFNTFEYAGFGSLLQWAYLIIIIVGLIVYLYLSFNKNIKSMIAIYLVSSIAYAYAILVGVYVAPHTITVTFLIVVFIFTTIFVDHSYKINIFTLSATTTYLILAYLLKTKETFSSEIVNTLTVVALALVLGSFVRRASLQNIEMKESLRKQAYTDQLTSLPNRRKLFEDLALSEKTADIRKIRAFALLDIDYFKKYNDTYGHQVGDECLRKISSCLLSLQENKDICVYRFGGEEFLVAFWNMDEKEIHPLLDNFISNIKELNIPHQESEYKVVTMSGGFAQFSDIMDNKYESLISNADKALYKAKDSGRNTLVYYNRDLDTQYSNIPSKFRT